jgi:hypothetical protein
MERAKIYVLDDKGKKMENKTIEVMFNPKDYAHSLNVEWEGENEDIPEFKRSNFGTLTITLFFDSYEKGVDVREDHEIRSSGKVRKIAGTKRIIELGLPSVEGKDSKRPPICLFSWGKFNFKCVIENVKQEFTMFLSNGIPVRAKVTITMKPVTSVQDTLKMKGIEACRKIRIVKEGDRLDIIAAEELKDPLLWRKIAKANDIADPLNFPGPDNIGRVLIIPD